MRLVCAVATARNLGARLSSILVLTSVQLTILAVPKGNERADSRQSGFRAALRWTGADRFLSPLGW
jgi:hypothetical protein